MLKNKKSLRVLIFITSILIASQTLGYYKSYGTEISPRNTGFDLDGNGKVDVFDLAKVALKYNLSNSSGDFDVLLDLNKDNFIDLYDLTLVSKAFSDKISIDYYGIKPTTVSEEELNKKVIKFYDEYSSKYFKKVPGKNQMYIDYIIDERLDLNADWVDRQAVTVSEAHGYGMLAITNIANMAPERREELEGTFKEFYNFFKAHPSNYSSNLMCWQMMGVGYNQDGTGTLTDVVNTSDGADSAIDGDMDIAYSLLLADRIWGSSGAINYKEEALKIIKDIYKLEVNKDDNILLLGDWVLAKGDVKYKTVTRTSDFMVEHLRTFAKVDTENSAGWLKVLDKSEELIESNVKNWSKNTGLVADFLVKENGVYSPAKGNVLEDVNDGDYNYNACRVPWRLSIDSLYNNEARLKDDLNIFNTWIKNKTANNPAKIKPGYYVIGGTTGTAIAGRDYVDLSFVAPMISEAATDKNNQQWVNLLFAFLDNKSINDESYFGNSLKLMSYISISGNNLTIK